MNKSEDQIQKSALKSDIVCFLKQVHVKAFQWFKAFQQGYSKHQAATCAGQQELGWELASTDFAHPSYQRIASSFKNTQMT